MHIAAPIWFEFLLAAVCALTLAVQLTTGRLDLHSGPAEYRRATRAGDPGRYWAFIIGLSVVTLAMLGEAVHRSLG